MKFHADRWRWTSPGRGRSGGVRSRARSTRSPRAWALQRRGADHGAVARLASLPISPGEARERWDRAEPVHLRKAFGPRLGAHRAAIARTVALFERLRGGADFEPDLWRRAGEDGPFLPAGVSVDLGDEREIEKVHADLRRGGRIVARDLWAKLSWITADPRDDSLRIRFSFGAERSDDWRSDPRRAGAADAFAEAVFPECKLLGRHARVGELLKRWTGRKVRLSERIIFSNSPGGGAAFHHDAEEGQLGVAYAQLTGRTAWLAIAKRELAAEVADLVGSGSSRGADARALAAKAATPARALRALDAADLPALEKLLNRSPRLTRRLVERGAFHVLAAGDVLLLPSHGPDDAAWHSVFALGDRPSLSHSFGIFPDRKKGPS